MRKGQGVIEYGLIIALVVVVVAVVLVLLFTPDKTYHGKVVDKQSIGTSYASADLVISVIVDGRKQVFLARNGVVFASVDIGDTCDFITYQGMQGIIVIREAKCNADTR